MKTGQFTKMNWPGYDLLAGGLAGWLAMHLRFILIFCGPKIERVRELIQSGQPGHVNAAVSTINFSTPAVWDMLSLHFLSINFSALSLLYFILLYYEDSVKPFAMKWVIHAWLQGIKKVRGGCPSVGMKVLFEAVFNVSN